MCLFQARIIKNFTVTQRELSMFFTFRHKGFVCLLHHFFRLFDELLSRMKMKI